jgi:hypothetical protein
MDFERCYAVNDKPISHHDFGDEVVIIHFETGNYYSLRGSAATVWKCLAQTAGSPATLLTAFANPPANAVDEIAVFLANLHSKSLITPAATVEDLSATWQGDVPYEAPQFEAFEDLQALLVADVIHDTDERGWPHLASEGDGPNGAT